MTINGQEGFVSLCDRSLATPEERAEWLRDITSGTKVNLLVASVALGVLTLLSPCLIGVGATMAAGLGSYTFKKLEESL